MSNSAPLERGSDEVDAPFVSLRDGPRPIHPLRRMMDPRVTPRVLHLRWVKFTGTMR